MGSLTRKRDELVVMLELLLEEGSDPNCRQGSTGSMSEVGFYGRRLWRSTLIDKDLEVQLICG